MSGGRLQLAIKGVEFTYLSAKPQTSLFRHQYNRITYFAMEPQEVNSSNRISFGSKFKFIIPPGADLLSHSFLKFQLPNLEELFPDVPNISYTNGIGHALFESIEFVVGSTVISKLSTYSLDIMSNFQNSEIKEGYDRMIGKEKRETFFKNCFDTSSKTSFILPLRFWFSKNISTSFPLCCVKQPISIVVTTKSLKDVVISDYDLVFPSNTIPIEMSLINNIVLLDKSERLILQKNPQIHLIEQNKITKYGIPPHVDEVKIPLILNHPIKTLRFVIVRDDRTKYSTSLSESSSLEDIENIHYGNDYFNYSDKLVYQETKLCYENTFKQAKITMNSSERIPFMDAEYFRSIQPYQHDIVIPKEQIYTYSFASSISLSQPSGFCNFTPIKTSFLELKVKPQEITRIVYILSTNYNLLRFNSSSCHLKYS